MKACVDFRLFLWARLAALLSIMLALPPLAQRASASAAIEPFYITFEGEPRAYIVISDDPSPPEKYAADELKSALQKMSGAELPVVSYSKRPGGSEIVIGTPESLQVVADAALFTTGHEEEVRIVRRGSTLFLAGPTPRAALYATYTFLQDVLGARWFWPGSTGEYLPSRRTIAVEQLDVRQTPSLEVRSLSINDPHYDLETLTWMARNRMNLHNLQNPKGTDHRVLAMKMRGFQVAIDGHNATLPDEVLRAHPEYIAEYNGMRQAPPGRRPHLDWSNPGAQKAMAEEIGRWWDANPQVDYVSFYGPDHTYFCNSPQCIAFAPDVSTRWQKFAKAVIEHLEQTHPGRKYRTLAYQDYRDVPTEVAPFDMVGYTTYNINYTKPITDPSNAHVRDEIKAWQDLGVPMGIRGYHFVIFNPTTYTPQTSLIMEEIAWAARSGLKGWTSEVTPFGWPSSLLFQLEKQNWVTNRMALYAAAQAMWNHELRPEDLMRDWAEYIFGPAAAEMLAYYTLMENAWRSTPSTLTYFLNNPAAFAGAFINQEVVDRAELHLKNARRALADLEDGRLRARIAAQIELEEAMFAAWRTYHRVRLGVEERYETDVPLAGTRPAFDADPEDPAWRNALSLPPFVGDDLTVPDPEIEAYIMWNEEALYVRVVDQRGAANDAGERDGTGAVLAGDTVELFVGTGERSGGYYHFAVNFDGHKYEARVDPLFNVDAAWDPEWTAHSFTSGGRWIVDVAIPFAALGSEPKVGQTWRLAVQRAGSHGRSGWPDATYHNPASFAAATLVERLPERKRLVLYHAGSPNPERGDALRAAFTETGFSATLVRSEQDLAEALERGADVLVLHHPGGAYVSPGTAEHVIKPFVMGGGLLVVAANGAVPLDQWFGQGAAVQWSGWDIHPFRRSTWSAPGSWQWQPHALQDVIRNRITPASAYRPLSDAWEVLAKLRMADDEEIPYLMRQDLGKGQLVLTSSDLGYGGGHEMFGSLNTRNAAMLVDNLLADLRRRDN